MAGLQMPIKDKLREMRVAAGLTQQALAMQAGLSVSAVVQIESGKVPDPRVSTLKALAKALGVSIDALAENGSEEAPLEEPAREGKEAKRPQQKGRGKGGKQP